MLAASAALLSPPIGAQAAAAENPAKPIAGKMQTAAFERADGEKAVADLATALEENFVFPEAGRKYAAMLRTKLAAGGYSSFEDAKAFTDTVTADLQAVHKDGHLRLGYVPAEYRKGKQGAGGGGGPPETSAVARSGWLADGVAYIDFTGFPGNEATLADVRRFIAAHSDAKTLIIDARRNGGGGLAEMHLLFEQLYAQPTTLVAMDIRQAVEEKKGNFFDEGDDKILREIAGPPTIIRREHFVTPAAQQRGLKTAKVYLLTSKKTFSAAEHLSLSLKRTKRATLVGEATGGGAHFGGVEPMGESYAAFIPVGRTFDPDTGHSWEGTGVKPDIAVPADQALDVALRLAGLSVSGEVALASLK
jgi:hypothetical protein